MDNQRIPRKAFIQLLASLAVLGAVLVTRIFFPDETSAFIRSYISGGLDYTAVLGGVGDGLRSFVLGVPHPNEQQLDGLQETNADEPGPPPQTDMDERPAYGWPEETYDPENEPPPEEEGSPPALAGGQGGFDAPITWANAELFSSFPDGEDDTLPIPFGTTKPEQVDFYRYELPFDTVIPADGRFSSDFGYRIHPVHGDWRFHYGIDIAGEPGTPVGAFADGTVAAVGVSASYGNYVIVEHSGGYVTLYAHCKKITVAESQTVAAGSAIATIGSTGVSTGPHLHFELRRGDAFLNPALYLNLSAENGGGPNEPDASG